MRTAAKRDRSETFPERQGAAVAAEDDTAMTTTTMMNDDDGDDYRERSSSRDDNGDGDEAAVQRQRSKRRSTGVRWDEGNLRDNEVIRREVIANMRLNQQTIDEAKTPYVQYEEDTIDTAHPVPKVRFSSISTPSPSSSSSSSSSTAAAAAAPSSSSEWEDDESPSRGARLTDTTSSVQAHQDSLISPREVQTHVVEPRDQMEQLQRAFALNGRISGSSGGSSSDASPLSNWESDDQPTMDKPLSPSEKRDLFQEKRRRHYNEFLVMKQLRESGQLTDDDDDEEEEEQVQIEREEEEARERQLRFQEKRRQHYGEYLVMKRLREMGQLEEEEDSEEEEGENTTSAMQL